MSVHPIAMWNTRKLKQYFCMRHCLSEWTDVKVWQNEKFGIFKNLESTKISKIAF